MNRKIIFYAIRYYLNTLPIFSKQLKKTLNKKNLAKKKLIKANSRYCYSVWLRHLSIIKEYGFEVNPNIIAELGPGDSIGVGLMALLTGAQRYYALDVVKRTAINENDILLDELVALLQNKEDIPDEREFPRMHPRLKSYSFPSEILNKKQIDYTLYSERINNIKENLLNYENTNNKIHTIKYFCPWYDSNVINEESVDMIFSQAVLEHVNDLERTYMAMNKWLIKGGLMSHQIDFKSHGTSDKWNGHWAYNDFEWKLITGRNSYLLNREPLSTHKYLLEKNGFKILNLALVKTYPKERYIGSISKHQLIEKYKKMSEEDFTTCSAHILSIKQQ